MEEKVCGHIAAITELKHAHGQACEACVKTGGTWVHLRTCQTCGITLCCDSSPSRHMTQHFRETDHPVVISSEPGEQWLWCYADKSFAEYS